MSGKSSLKYCQELKSHIEEFIEKNFNKKIQLYSSQ